MENLRLNKFNPKILEKRSREGNTPVITVIGSGTSTGIRSSNYDIFKKKIVEHPTV